MRITEIVKLMCRMDGRENLEKLTRTIESLFQFKMREGFLASILVSKKHAKYHLIKSKISTEHLKILQDVTLEMEFREKIDTNWNTSNSYWNKVCQILTAFQRPMRIIEIAKFMGSIDGREDLGKLTRTIESLFQFKIKKGVLASIRFSKRHVEYILIK